MWTNKGTWLGLMLLALNPIARILVLVYSITGRYPAWLVTPDDPVSPYGKNEPTVCWVYAHLNKWAGDVYWLGFRNVLYGLTYHFKPSEFKETTDYSDYQMSQLVTGRTTLTTVAGFKEWVVNIGPMSVISGWKVKGVWNDPKTIRQPINMEFTPVFSIRRRKDA